MEDVRPRAATGPCPRNGWRPRGTHVALALALAFLLAACGGSGATPPSAAIPSGATSAPAVPGSSSTPSSSMAAEACLGIPAGVSSTMQLSVDGTARSALVHVPRSTGATSPTRPVVMAFHGYNGTSNEVEDMGRLSVKADAEGFIAVYPQALGSPAKWDVAGATDIAFVDALLTKLVADPCVDPARIDAVGMSMGGGMANMVACRLAGRIAGLATVAGVYGPRWGEPCNATRPVPVIAFHGLKDPQVPYAGGPIDDPDMGPGGNPDLPPVIGVEAWAAAWAGRNGCAATAQPQPAIGKVEPLFWMGCAAPVELYRVTDGGHTWPGSPIDEPMTNRDVSATDLIWDFLSRFSLGQG